MEAIILGLEVQGFKVLRSRVPGLGLSVRGGSGFSVIGI